MNPFMRTVCADSSKLRDGANHCITRVTGVDFGKSLVWHALVTKIQRDTLFCLYLYI